MINLLLTWPHLSVYAQSVFNKLKTGFDSLNYERIWPLCGFFFFYIRNHCAFVFKGGIAGSLRAAGARNRSVNPATFRPPVSRMGGGFPETVKRSNRP